MAEDDDIDLMGLDDDDDILDSLMESKSFNEELIEIFPPEEKFQEVMQNV
jgi:hypothetical protein